jgi:hypothetical protein
MGENGSSTDVKASSSAGADTGHPGAQGAPAGAGSAGQKLPEDDSKSKSDEDGDKESKGTGEKVVHVTGVKADGGDFDAYVYLFYLLTLVLNQVLEYVVHFQPFLTF